MIGSSVREAALEVRQVVETIRGEEEAAAAGPVVVSGMLAEQLARELGRDANAGAVVVGDSARLHGASVAVHVLAADPSEDDEAFVRVADDRCVPVVLVQLWPQADWTPPFVLTPFVVECRAGEGFPVREIAARVFEASPSGHDLARTIPALRDVVQDGLIARSVARAALIGALGSRLGPSRPQLVLEQVRMLSRLRAADSEPKERRIPATLTFAATALGLGLALRSCARTARRVLPGPVANAAVAAGGTWAVGHAIRRLDTRR